MPITSGVTKENYKLEKKYNLWNIFVTLEESQKIADWFCKEYELYPVTIKFSKSKHWYGAYLPNKRKIFLYDRSGQCLAVLLHEIAHHYSSEIFVEYGHKEYFTKAHTIILEKTQEMKKII